MPRTFTNELVHDRLEWHSLPTEGTEEEKRIRLADFIEAEFQDFAEGWEIRTGRPWNKMTKEEAVQLVCKHPQCVRNPAVLSKMMGG